MTSIPQSTGIPRSTGQMAHLAAVCPVRSQAAGVVVWLAAAAAAAQVGCPDYGPLRDKLVPRCHCREYWIVNTRQAPTCDDLPNGFERLTYSKFDGDRGWIGYRREEFVAAMDPSVPTTFFVHGSFLDHKGAVRAGWRFYHEFDSDAGADRLVLWSWPAERIPGMNAVNNLLVKMVRSEKQGYYLAALVEQLDPALPLSLVGHSLGGRTICAALEGLASGEVSGAALPPPSSTAASVHTGDHRAIRVGLLVPAFDPRYLWPGGRYGNALSQVDRVLIAYNPRDRLLAAHARIVSPWILGRNGMPQPERLGENRHKLVEVNSQGWVHHGHIFVRYAKSPQAIDWLRRYVFHTEALGDGR
jgi:hypothetical protein